MTWNPYSNRRTLPVGQNGYTLESSKLFKKAAYHMLEYGEPEFVFDIPRIVGGGSMLNLGDALGGSATLLALGLLEHNLEGHVWTVDNYGDNDAIRAFKNYEKSGVEDRIEQIQETTQDAFTVLQNREYDFIFIDASHKYKNVLEDWELYSTLVSQKGLIAFHDTNQDDTHKVIEQVERGEWEITHWINRIKCYRRT